MCRALELHWQWNLPGALDRLIQSKRLAPFPPFCCFKNGGRRRLDCIPLLANIGELLHPGSMIPYETADRRPPSRPMKSQYTSESAESSARVRTAANKSCKTGSRKEGDFLTCNTSQPALVHSLVLQEASVPRAWIRFTLTAFSASSGSTKLPF